jgi:GH15 family glucan-1,4-alpha-glucosidase
MPYERRGGYAAIRDYAAIGDGRTVALVARDGAIDWLCLPNLDSPSTFGALLDAQRGGSFVLRPTAPFDSARRYVPKTNVLETTFTTATGVVRVTDALTLPGCGLSPYRELARQVESLSGEVPMEWAVEPRFGYGGSWPRREQRAGVPVATSGRDALAVCSWNAGAARWDERGAAIAGSFTATDGQPSLVVLSVAHQEPLVLPSRADVEERLLATARLWREWVEGRDYDGMWRDAVLRSALALKLLVFAPSGAIAAAATSSLPETIGGERNWDYRYSWPRDAAFTLEALLALGCSREARAFFWWLLHASQLTHPRLHVLYRLDGGVETEERSLPLAGYRGSQPVRVGNAASTQTQLDVYGEVLQAVARFAAFDRGLDRDHGRRAAAIVDFVCATWRDSDAGIWEVRDEPRHYTQSKMMCAVALRSACTLHDRGVLKGDLERWRRELKSIREFVETRCYSERTRSYVRSADEEDLDASLLLAVLAGYDDPRSQRLVATVDAVARSLREGPFVRRYRIDDGLRGEEGAFLTCSFWLVEAYARQGRLEEATQLMDELVDLANDVGLYSEEIDPETGEFLGNFPQALTHLALINAAVSFASAQEAGR